MQIITIGFDFFWLPKTFGGRIDPPFDGMYTSMRGQSALKPSWIPTQNLKWCTIHYDLQTRYGHSIAEFHWLPDTWLEVGGFIEVLDGFQVIAVGKVTNIIR